MEVANNAESFDQIKWLHSWGWVLVLPHDYNIYIFVMFYLEGGVNIVSLEKPYNGFACHLTIICVVVLIIITLVAETDY